MTAPRIELARDRGLRSVAAELFRDVFPDVFLEPGFDDEAVFCDAIDIRSASAAEAAAAAASAAIAAALAAANSFSRSRSRSFSRSSGDIAARFLSFISKPCVAKVFVMASVVFSGFDVMAAVVIDMIEEADGARRTSLFFDGVSAAFPFSGFSGSFVELRLKIEVFEAERDGGGTVTSFCDRFDDADVSRLVRLKTFVFAMIELFTLLFASFLASLTF